VKNAVFSLLALVITRGNMFDPWHPLDIRKPRLYALFFSGRSEIHGDCRMITLHEAFGITRNMKVVFSL
jgi:hypothetical protein